MTKREAESIWKATVMPEVRLAYEADGVPDYPARREAWNEFIDSLWRDRIITQRQCQTWGHPRGNTAPRERP